MQNVGTIGQVIIEKVYSMKLVISVFAVFLVVSFAYAQNACQDAEGKPTDQAQCAESSDTKTQSLPEEAAAKVKKLRVEMRYFMAIGFHKHSNERREAIAAIYAEHGVPLPKEFQK